MRGPVSAHELSQLDARMCWNFGRFAFVPPRGSNH